jgi:hypothetical protein
MALMWPSSTMIERSIAAGHFAVDQPRQDDGGGVRAADKQKANG